ncbi:MAG: type 4a pilus biogenesis protein PilO [Gemmatirosa sp.]|nr:type 4a pilus biogenesis protein PilO [Gemmatirosa sp.]
MGLLPTSQRDQTKLFIGVIAVALAGYYYSYPYTQRATELEQLEQRVEQIEGQNARAKALASHGDLAKLKAEAERTGASLDAMRRLVPTEHEVPALLEEISTAARRAGLEIGGVTPEPVLRGEEFDTYRYKIGVVGGFHPLTTFLANVGSLPRIVAPVTFTLAPAQDAAARTTRSRVAALTATVTLQAYVAHAPVAPREPAPKPAASAGETQP